MNRAFLVESCELLWFTLLDLFPRQPVIYGERDCLCIGRSLLARLLETICLISLGLMGGYVLAIIVDTRSWLSVVVGILLLTILSIAAWLLRGRIIRTTLIVDPARDRITQGSRLIARASDVQAVHVGGRRQPAVLVLRDRDTSHLRNSVLPHVEGGDGHLVGLTLATYLDVALLRVELSKAASKEAA